MCRWVSGNHESDVWFGGSDDHFVVKDPPPFNAAVSAVAAVACLHPASALGPAAACLLPALKAAAKALRKNAPDDGVARHLAAACQRLADAAGAAGNAEMAAELARVVAASGVALKTKPRASGTAAAAAAAASVPLALTGNDVEADRVLAKLTQAQRRDKLLAALPGLEGLPAPPAASSDKLPSGLAAGGQAAALLGALHEYDKSVAVADAAAATGPTPTDVKQLDAAGAKAAAAAALGRVLLVGDRALSAGAGPLWSHTAAKLSRALSGAAKPRVTGLKRARDEGAGAGAGAAAAPSSSSAADAAAGSDAEDEDEAPPLDAGAPNGPEAVKAAWARIPTVRLRLLFVFVFVARRH